MNSENPAGAATSALSRFFILFALLLIALRGEVLGIVGVGLSNSDWSHMLALPVVAYVLLRLRSDDWRGVDMSPSFWGLVLLAAGLFVWFAVYSLGLFGYLRDVALAVATGGVVLLSAGPRVFRLCVPLLIAFCLCLPLYERSMDRFTIGIQNMSIRAGAAVVDRLDAGDVRAEGREIVRRSGDVVQRVGQGELRFGFRMFQACAMIAILVVFSRKRSAPQLVFLLLAILPTLLLVNVLRIVVWTMVSFMRNAIVVDDVPRNLSAFAAMLLTFVLVIAAGWLIEKLSGVSSLFYSEDDSEDDSIEAKEEAVS
ncbi:MAG: exosortase/archaeosortase family protein [Phycisphaerales bacterium]|nr:exosortase/archaeosortase family protein [Phycisphaerales bacterium]MCB9856288.1 exosortase/archaeosortase family protein [Phycisphaerales bacterium]MCB9863273.1 exosortase/archaeosortase family protein [Phycisphaerales bacterium]